MLIEAGPLVQLRISLSRVPLRTAPAWSVLAGAIAVAPVLTDTSLWLRVVAAIILGDLAWGILRHYAQVPAAHQGAVFALPLPYAQPDAPLSRLLGGLSGGGATWQGAVAGIVLALGGGLLLGWPAVALSLVAIVVTALAGSLVRRGDYPAIAFALLDVLLPWTLGMLAAGWDLSGGRWWAPLVVAVALTALQWGVLRSAASDQGSPRAINFGALAVIITLVGLSMPGAAALTAVLIAPPLYWLGAARPATGADSRFAWSGPWLMLTLILAALALR